MNPAHTALADALDRWRRRNRWRRALLRAWRALWPGALALAALTLLGCLLPPPAALPLPPQQLAPLAWAALFAAAALWGATARCSLAEAAQLADLRLHTHALFVTALDALQRDPLALSDPERDCLHHATLTAAQTADAQAAPLRFGPRALLPLPIALAFLASPLTPWAVDQAQQQQQQALQNAAEELKKLQENLPKTLTADLEAQRELADRLQRLRQQIRKQELTQREAAEALGELKRELRAQSQAQAQKAQQPSPGAQAAARELAGTQQTQALSKALGQAARDDLSPAERQEAARDAAQQTRQLDALQREQRQEAADKLRDAARASREQGDLATADALQNAAQALDDNNPQALQQAANDLQRATQGQPSDATSQLSQAEMEQLAQELERIQQELGQRAPGQPGQQTAQGGDEGKIAPGPRDWKPGKGQGKGDGDGDGDGDGADSRAGKGHSQGEASPFQTGDHKDTDRFGDKTSDPWLEAYQELHAPQLLNSPSRITTRVQGERDGAGEVTTMRAGEQTPRDEQARRALQRLPVGYSDAAQRDVDGEAVPPAYRDAVRDYFDTGK